MPWILMLLILIAVNAGLWVIVRDQSFEGLAARLNEDLGATFLELLDRQVPQEYREQLAEHAPALYSFDDACGVSDREGKNPRGLLQGELYEIPGKGGLLTCPGKITASIAPGAKIRLLRRAAHRLHFEIGDESALQFESQGTPLAVTVGDKRMLLDFNSRGSSKRVIIAVSGGKILVMVKEGAVTFEAQNFTEESVAIPVYLRAHSAMISVPALSNKLRPAETVVFLKNKVLWGPQAETDSLLALYTKHFSETPLGVGFVFKPANRTAPLGKVALNMQVQSKNELQGCQLFIRRTAGGPEIALEAQLGLTPIDLPPDTYVFHAKCRVDGREYYSGDQTQKVP